LGGGILVIENYQFGRIVVNGKSFNHDVVISKERVDSWWRISGHNVAIKDVEGIASKKPKTIIFGKGYSGVMKVSADTKKYLEEKGIKVIEKETEEAVRLFNELSKKEDVVAALHLTC
jgi:hypothetical protein